jgi:hypothetical protein
MKISKADLAALQKEGVTVQRALGKQPNSSVRSQPKKGPKKEVVRPNKEVISGENTTIPHASMGASMADSAAYLEAANQILARNGEIIREFAESVRELKPKDPGPYTFKIKRRDDLLMERVYALPGIIDD